MSSMDQTSADARDQINKLRDQVDALMRDRVSPALSDAANRAEKMASDTADMARDQAEMLGDRVRDQPLVALLAAAGIGYLVGRIVR